MRKSIHLCQETVKACLEYFRLMAIFRQMAVSAALPTCFHVTTNGKKCYQGLSGNVGLDFFSGFFFFIFIFWDTKVPFTWWLWDFCFRSFILLNKCWVKNISAALTPAKEQMSRRWNYWYGFWASWGTSPLLCHFFQGGWIKDGLEKVHLKNAQILQFYACIFYQLWPEPSYIWLDDQGVQRLLSFSGGDSGKFLNRDRLSVPSPVLKNCFDLGASHAQRKLFKGRLPSLFGDFVTIH